MEWSSVKKIDFLDLRCEGNFCLNEMRTSPTIVAQLLLFIVLIVYQVVYRVDLYVMCLFDGGEALKCKLIIQTA